MCVKKRERGRVGDMFWRSRTRKTKSKRKLKIEIRVGVRASTLVELFF